MYTHLPFPATRDVGYIVKGPGILAEGSMDFRKDRGKRELSSRDDVAE